MKLKFLLILGVVVLCAASLSTHAAIITLSPQQASATNGEQMIVDVLAFDLGDGITPSIGIFDIDIGFDASILSFANANYGDQLDLFGFGSLKNVDDSVAGNVSIFELSFDLPSDLDGLQTGNFLLASLVFDTLSVGESALTGSINALGDSFGDPISFEIVNSDVTVNPVPVPPAAPLFLISIMILALTRIQSA